MYSERQLVRLDRHKAALRQRITARRATCAAAVARVAQPVEWLGRVIAFVRKLSPLALLAALPLGGLLKRSASPRWSAITRAVRWVPLAFSALRGLRAAAGQAREMRRGNLR